MSHSGGQIGNIVALLSGGYLCYIEFAGGWPSIFYIFGSVGMVWVGVIFLLFSSTPNDNRFISFAEKSYLNQNIKIEDKKNMVTSIYCRSFSTIFCLHLIQFKLRFNRRFLGKEFLLPKPVMPFLPVISALTGASIC